MLSEQFISCYDANKNWCYSNYVAKEGLFIDYRPDLTPRGELLGFVGFKPYPNVLICDSVILFSLRYSLKPARKTKKRDSRADKLYAFFDTRDSVLLNPDLPLFALAFLPDSGHVFADRTPEEVYNLNMASDNLQPKAYLGKIDPRHIELYRKEGAFYPWMVDFAFDFHPRSMVIAYNFKSFPEIYLETLDGLAYDVVGKKGRHIPPGVMTEKLTLADFDTASFTRKNANEMYLRSEDLMLAAYWNSPQYRQVKFDTLNRLLYRVYWSPSKPYDLDSLFQLYQKDEEALLEHVAQQSVYLQIYDAADDYKLIYDEPVPAPFHIIGTDEDGFLWAVTGWNDDDVELSKYKVER